MERSDPQAKTKEKEVEKVVLEKVLSRTNNIQQQYKKTTTKKNNIVEGYVTTFGITQRRH